MTNLRDALSLALFQVDMLRGPGAELMRRAAPSLDEVDGLGALARSMTEHVTAAAAHPHVQEASHGIRQALTSLDEIRLLPGEVQFGRSLADARSSALDLFGMVGDDLRAAAAEDARALVGEQIGTTSRVGWSPLTRP